MDIVRDNKTGGDLGWEFTRRLDGSTVIRGTMTTGEIIEEMESAAAVLRESIDMPIDLEQRELRERGGDVVVREAERDDPLMRSARAEAAKAQLEHDERMEARVALIQTVAELGRGLAILRAEIRVHARINTRKGKDEIADTLANLHQLAQWQDKLIPLVLRAQAGEIVAAAGEYCEACGKTEPGHFTHCPRYEEPAAE